ncbi:hypothetical protein OE88DRAFT_1740525 [Heliocybe sulcata]|uniref:Uncharacterized protein n=1 Tax=Heliocybe sulcata TaxID=5364 RepID=A0A5C3MID0_9AGAM|nr:hypothetical protein OE88DRAFT_1740525 [Heliocybe sulcata]
MGKKLGLQGLHAWGSLVRLVRISDESKGHIGRRSVLLLSNGTPDSTSAEGSFEGENAEDFDVSNETPSALQKSCTEAKPEDTQDPSNPPESSDNVSIPPPASQTRMKHPTPAPVQCPQRDHQSSQYAQDLMSGEEHTSVKLNDLSIPAGLQIPRRSFTIEEVPDEGDEAGGIENALVAKTGEAEALNPCNLGDVRKHPDWPRWGRRSLSNS